MSKPLIQLIAYVNIKSNRRVKINNIKSRLNELEIRFEYLNNKFFIYEISNSVINLLNKYDIYVQYTKE